MGKKLEKEVEDIRRGQIVAAIGTGVRTGLVLVAAPFTDNRFIYLFFYFESNSKSKVFLS